MDDTNRYTHYLVLFLCSMIIPAMNTSAVSIALSNNIVDLIFYIIDFGVFGWGIKRLKEKDEHPIGIILVVINYRGFNHKFYVQYYFYYIYCSGSCDYCICGLFKL